MKKCTILFLFACLFILCDEDNPSSPGSGNSKGDIYVSIDFTRSKTTSLLHPTINGQEITVSADITRGSATGQKITDAVVKINGFPLTYTTFMNRYYLSDVKVVTFTPGKFYTFSVTVDGITSVDSVQAPGRITIDPEAMKESWTHEGNGDWMATFPIDGKDHDPIWQSYPSITDLASPQTISKSALNLSGRIITLQVVIKNTKFLSKSGFASLSNVEITDLETFDFQR